MNPLDNTENTATPKQQVVERVKQATNILVTVNNDPTVDQLAAAIGLTIMLNALNKHATAVFSGNVPSTLEFLRPEETIEQNTDSLRDFIVSLDKSKADKLRYKVEENVVKIFITPYRTSISEKDLEFTQGDFNVDVVLALGVSVRENLDQAIVAHGRILHDATVVTISAGQTESTLGNINWQDPAASSLSEMIVSISEAFQGGLIDGQMATAFLTGIVSETERFSNTKTTPKVMTMSAQLMAAGANQQLIATELEKAQVLPEPVAESEPEPAPETVEEPTPAKSPDGSLSIKHEDEPEPPKKEEPKPEPESEPEPAPVTPYIPPPKKEEPEIPIDDTEIHIDNNGTLKKQWEVEAEKKESGDSKNRHKVIAPLNQAPKPEGPKTDLKNFSFDQPAAPQPFSAAMPEQPPEQNVDPLTPAVSAEEPLAPVRENESVLPPPPTPAADNDLPSFVPPPTVEPPQPAATGTPELATAPVSASPEPDTLADIEKAVHSPHVAALPPEEGVDTARNAVMDAINATPYDPARPEPLQSLNAAPLGTVSGAPEHSVPAEPAPAQATTQATFPLQDANTMFASHSSSATPQFQIPDQPAPQVPGGMPLHELGETIEGPKQNEDDEMLPPPVPPPMTAV